MNEKLESMVLKDLNFDISDASNILMTNARKRAKYSTILLKLQAKYDDLELDRKSKFGELWKYYTTDFDQILDRRDVTYYIESDIEYQKVLKKMNEVQRQIKFIDEVLHSLKNLSFEMNGVIKWEMYQNGE